MDHRLTRRAAAGMLALPMLARAQAFPARPIRVIASYAPGGSVDVSIRLIAPGMADRLGQAVVIENRAGATGSVGAAAVAQAPADGYTLLADASGQATNPSLLKNLSFDYARAFAPVGQISTVPHVLVTLPAFPVRTVAELVAYLRARPGEVSYASSGIASGPHLAAAQFLRRAGASAQHVPYRGSSLAMQDVLAGNVGFTFSTVPQATPLVKDGRLRALAVSTRARLGSLPEVPTLDESGFPGFDINEWIAVWAPAGTPGEAIGRVGAALRGAVADASVQARFAEIGLGPVGSTPEELAAFVAAQRTAMAELITVENIRLD